ncbi:DoxX family protein [Azohydromonas australica]|uniref:DoxX family protein n=1 Tax=Azohydromonas australica TaxID=364039 RepID=UPI00041D72F6|nr:DoxX family protein [Azohydromonas australica]
MNQASFQATTDAAALSARTLMAAIFLVSAAGKVADPAGTIGYIASVGLPVPALAYGVALLAELLGGLLLTLGWRTRWAAIALAGFSVTSALLFHNAVGDQNQLFHFLKNLAMAGGLLQLAAFGPGRLSLDAKANRQSPAASVAV